MRSGGVLLAARDMERTKTFYQEVLGLEVVADYGTNVALTGGLSLQMLGSWAEALGKGPADIAFGGDTGEVYFVAEDYDAVLKALREHPDVELVHPPMEQRWGQRVVRVYDPDRHIVEIDEPLAAVCRRFLDGGLNEEGVARRMDIPLEQVRGYLKQVR